MPRFVAAAALAIVLAASHAALGRATDPNATIASSEQVLNELVAIPGRRIPTSLIREAQGVAIIPRVIKIGFVAGIRRGHGVVLVRDADGAWGLPRFVRLTGGSVGWQAGVQGTDVVLVFRTRRSLDNLMRGKFTIGVDAAAAAGPVGRNVAAGTDLSLQAEVLSYSRSRGLFAGAALDGSMIEMDAAANTAFYGSADPESPQVVPLAATRLQSMVMALTTSALAEGAATAQPGAPTAAAAPAPAGAVIQAADFTEVRIEALRQSLVGESANLAKLLAPEWQQFLALPASLGDPAALQAAPQFAEALSRYEKVAADPQFAALNQRPEFQSTLELLREYSSALQASRPTISLPAPPAVGDARR